MLWYRVVGLVLYGFSVFSKSVSGNARLVCPMYSAGVLGMFCIFDTQ